MICTSVNDAVLHGLPHDYDLRDGDLLTLDFAASLGGWVADAAVSFIVGTRKGSRRPAHDRRHPGRPWPRRSEAAQPGHRVGDISYAIGKVLQQSGYRVNTEFGGHGVGRTMHQDPHVSNNGRPRRGLRLEPGMLLAIEPWIMRDTDRLVVDRDGWTLRSATGCRTAHTEHTVAITANGPQVLTEAPG